MSKDEDTPIWQTAWRAFQDPYLGPDAEKFPSPFASFVAGFMAGRSTAVLVVGTPDGVLRRVFWAGHWWDINHIILNASTTPERIATGEWVEFDPDEPPSYADNLDPS